MDKNFTKLLLDTAKGKTIKYSLAESDEAIRQHFFEVLGIEPTSNRKEIRKALRRKSYDVYELIEETINEMLISGWGENPFFKQFVDVKNLAAGDSNVFYVPDKSILTVSRFSGNHHDLLRQKLSMGESFNVHTDWYGIKIYQDFELYMAGRIDWAEYIRKLYEALDKKVNDMLYGAFMGLDEQVPAAYQMTGTITEATILEKAEMVEVATGHPVMIAGTRASLSKITGLTGADMWSSEMKNERNTLGGLGTWNGIPLMRVPQVFEQNTRTFAYPDNKFYILPMTDNKPIKLVYEGDYEYVEDTQSTSRQDMTIEAEYMTKLGVATIVGLDFAVGKFA